MSTFLNIPQVTAGQIACVNVALECPAYDLPESGKVILVADDQMLAGPGVAGRSDDATYYAAREAAERRLAAASADDAIKAIHLTMADAYRQRQHRAAPSESVGALFR